MTTPIVIDTTAYAAVAGAASQTAQILALIAPWAGGNVTAQIMEGAAVAETSTYGPWVADAATPRGCNLGALLSGTVSLSGATPSSIVFLRGLTPIFSVLASDLTLDMPTTLAGRITNLADAVQPKLRITAKASLPVT